jgi:O-antigen ligase
MTKISNIISIVFILIFLALLPFQVWNNVVFPVQNGKILFAGWAAIVLFICWYIQVFIRKKGLEFSVSFVDIGVAGYTIFLFIHVVFITPVNIDELYIIRMFSLLPVYMLVRILPIKLNKYLFLTLLITGAIQAVWGIMQYKGMLPSYYNTDTASGTFFNPGPYAGYLVAVIPFAVAILFPANAKNLAVKSVKHIQIASIAVIIIIVTAIVISQSRSGWLALLASILFLLIRTHKKTLRLKHFLFIVLTAVVVIVLLYNLKKDSANGRLFIWGNTIEMIKDHPATGTGINTFGSQYMHYQAKWFQSHPNSKKDLLADNNIYAFNEPLRIASEQGLVGLLFVIILLALIFYGKQRNNTDLYFITMAKSSIIGIIIFSLFSYPFSILPLQVVFTVFVAIIASSQKPITVDVFTRQHLINAMAAGTVIIATTFFSFKLNDITTACRNFKTAIKLFKPNRTEESIILCKKALPHLKNNRMFVSIYGSLLTNAQMYYNAIPVLKYAAEIQPTTNIYIELGDCYLNTNDLKNAEKAYKYALQMIPSRIKPIYKLATMYALNNNGCEAISAIDSYLNRKDKKRTIASYEIELKLIEIKNELLLIYN